MREHEEENRWYLLVKYRVAADGRDKVGWTVSMRVELNKVISAISLAK